MIERDKKRYKLITKYAQKREKILSNLKSAKTLEEIFETQKKIQSLPTNSSKTRLKRRCWKTGRSRGFYRDFGLSRHVLREMMHQCLIPGLVKSSW